MGPSARARVRRFIGVSLGGGRGKTTAVARIELDEHEHERGPTLVVCEARVKGEHRGGGARSVDAGVERGPFHDRRLEAYLRRWLDASTVVAMDAPLTLPPCVRCRLPCPGIDACEVPAVRWMRAHAATLAPGGARRDPARPQVTPYTQRATELLLEHASLAPREALGQGMGPLAARAAYLRRSMSPDLRLHENLIEVHPRATLARLYGPAVERASRRGETGAAWETRRRMLTWLSEGMVFDGVWPELVVRNLHVFNAVVSAFTAVLWARAEGPGPECLREPVDRAERASEAGPGEAGRGEDPWNAALDEFGDIWLEDGWIWVPPAGAPRPLGA